MLVCCTGYSKLSKQPNKRSKITEVLAAICSKGQEPRTRIFIKSDPIDPGIPPLRTQCIDRGGTTAYVRGL